MTEPPDKHDDQKMREWSDALRPAAIPLIGWGIALCISAGIQVAFGGKLLPVLIQAGSGLFIALLGAAVVVISERSNYVIARQRPVPTLSFATVLAAVSITAIINGAAVGVWLIIAGGLGLVFAIAGIIRELRAQHRQ